MKRNILLILILALLVILIAGCGGGSGGVSGANAQLDKAKTIALRRDAQSVLNETKKFGLENCTGDLEKTPCADKGVECRVFAIAQEPSDCREPPTIKCICPEQTICIGQGITQWNSIPWKCIHASKVSSIATGGASPFQGEGRGGDHDSDTGKTGGKTGESADI